jgi:hypothetical protein
MLAGLAFGAPAGENVVFGNAAVATVTVKVPLSFAVADPPTFRVKTSVAAAAPVVNRIRTLSKLSTVAVPGAVGIVTQVVPPSTENSGREPVVANVPQILAGELMPATVNEGLVLVTVFGVVLSVAGERVKALGTLSSVRVKVLVLVPSVRVPVITAASAASPQRPEPDTFFQRVVIAAPLVTGVEAVSQVTPPSRLNSIQPVEERLPAPSAQVKFAVPGIVVGATALVIGASNTVTVKVPLCFAVAEAPTSTVSTSVLAGVTVVKRTFTVAPGFTVAVPGAAGSAVQVVPLSTVNCGLDPVGATAPQI